ncbi:Transposase IS4 [Popillia japonica]|uniref:Transposase IS4 n=1 Tax=Popillia japonica TaxID=7064 RepID=A0AAW1HSD3_POPJA
MANYLTNQQLANLAENFYDDIDEIENDALSGHNDHNTLSEFEVESQEESESPSDVHQNILFHLPETKGPAGDIPPRTPVEAWALLFTQKILNEILGHTNAKITEASVAYGPTASYVEHLDMIELLDELKRVGLTYVGTLRQNTRKIPPSFLSSRQLPVNSCKFGFTHDSTLVSFVPKKNSCLLLVSSMHHKGNVEENGKTEKINFYNNTKGGVDALDRKSLTYSCQRRTRRWRMAIFGAMLDISRASSYTPLLAASDNSFKMTKREFYIILGRELINEHITRRYEIKGLPEKLNLDIKNLLGIQTA